MSKSASEIAADLLFASVEAYLRAPGPTARAARPRIGARNCRAEEERADGRAAAAGGLMTETDVIAFMRSPIFRELLRAEVNPVCQKIAAIPDPAAREEAARELMDALAAAVEAMPAVLAGRLH